MESVLPFLLVNGVLLGAFYALMASGMNIIYGVMRIINLAHAGFIMLGAYFSLVLVNFFKIDPVYSTVLALPFFFLVGYAIYRHIVNRLARAPPIMSLLLLFSLWLVLRNLAYMLFTGDTQSITSASAFARTVDVGIPIPLTRIVGAVMAMAGVGLLYLILSRTKLGKAMRATAQDREVSSLLGINPSVIAAMTFGLGTALAAAAGCISTLLYAFDPAFGGNLLIKAFLIIVLGGLESIMGMAMAGLMVGLLESFAGFYLRFGLVDAMSFVLFIIILVVRPSGLFGKVRF